MGEEKVKKKVALYIRVSTEEQVEMYGVDLQRSSLMGLIASKSQELEFAGEEYVYVDEGVSGSIPPEERPEFRRLMEDISKSTKKPFDVVAVYKIDRFARRLKLLLEVLELFNTEENKIEFLSASESIDTSTPFGRAMLGIIGVIAELEMENIKDRTSSGRQASAEQGTFMNVPPLGYVKDNNKKIVIQEGEKEVVERIFYMYARENRSLGYIARYLKEHKIRTPQAYRYYHKKEEQGSRKLSVGGQYSWDTSAVKNVLSNELYIGKQYYNKTKDGKKLPKEKWESYEHNEDFIDKEVFAIAQKLLSLNSRRRLTEVTKDRVYLLQGLLKCANCYNPTLHTEPYSWNGLSKTVKSTGNKSYYYACSTKHTHKKKLRGIDCKTIQVPAKPLEKHIIELIKQLIDNPQVVFKYQQELQSKKADIKNEESSIEKCENFVKYS
jgi:site-specific DNA recombinase